MADKGKILETLNHCCFSTQKCDSCPDQDCAKKIVLIPVPLKLMLDIKELLKEQEAKKVNISQMHYGIKYGLCPHCEKQIDTLVNPHYCGNCGQELKWE